VWSVAFAGLLAAPLLTAVSPSLEIPVLSAAGPEANAAATDPRASSPDHASAGRTPASPKANREHGPSRRARAAIELPTPPSVRAEAPRSTLSPGPEPRAAMGEAALSRVVPSNWRPTASEFLGALWMLGAAVLLTRLMIGTTATWRLVRRATAVRSTEDVNLLRGICEGLRTPMPALLLSRDIAIPVAVQLTRSAILVPAAFRSWPAPLRRAVLLHELAHLQRYDCRLQLVARLALALHWVNPLVWFAFARLGVERERACDDWVLADGLRPSAYAEHLLAIATVGIPAPPLAAAAFARTQQLPARVRAILNPTAGRKSPTWRTFVLVSSLAFIVLLPLAAAQPVAATATPPPAGAPGSISVPAVATTAAQAAVPAIEDLIRMRIHGVTPTFIEEMSEYSDDLDIKMLVQLRIHSVTPAYARDMRAAFGENVSLEHLVQGRIHGVTAEFADGMIDHLGDTVTFENLRQMRIHGTTTDFVTDMQGLLADEALTVNDIVQMRIHGVTANMVRDLNARGIDDLTADELVRIKIHGLDRVLRRRSGDDR
jgi:beta-lactamase regulating signal transducer with metallopeptidase domain